MQFENELSVKMNLDIGWAQGSVLGPKLFSMFLGELNNKLTNENVQVITYAEDTYGLVSEIDEDDVLKM